MFYYCLKWQLWTAGEVWLHGQQEHPQQRGGSDQSAPVPGGAPNKSVNRTGQVVFFLLGKDVENITWTHIYILFKDKKSVS